MGVKHQRGRRQQAVASVAGHDQVLARADAVGVAGDLGQAGRGGQVGVGPGVTGDDEVVRLAGRVEELDQRQIGALAKLLEVADLERLDEHGRPPAAVPGGLQGGQERLLERQADRVEVGRVLGLRVDAHVPPLGQGDHLREGGDLVEAVERGVGGPQVRDALLGPQRPQLGQREVLGEPAGQRDAVDDLGGPPAGELGVGGHVGRARDLVLVAGYEHVVLGRHQVRLDEVGPHGDGQLVGGKGVLGPVAAGAAVGEHQRQRALLAARRGPVLL